MKDMTLMINGAGEASIIDGKYYVNADAINKDGYDFYMQVSKEKFIEVLTTIYSWVPTSWDKVLVDDYYKILEEAKRDERDIK